MTSDVLFDIRGRTGVVTLNRPQALNALTHGMVRAMLDALRAWSGDPAIHAVVVEGAGDRAFCSGGDVKSVALAVKNGDSSLSRDFFRDEYTLNHLIFNYPKPYVCLIDGIVMGGGKGISAHGSHRVISEKITFAMPETNIGFFPDVGGGWFLPRCPGHTGAYLAMTSARIGAADAMYIGFGTHFVPSEKFAALRADILAGPENIDAVLAAYAAPAPGDSKLEKNRAAIDRHFGQDSVEAIFASLSCDASAFAQETLAALRGMSPTSLKIALEQIRRGGRMQDFGAVMTMEYRLSQFCVRQPDFYEGIRAALIDKDRAPKWNPSRPEDVSPALIEGAFASLGQMDLVFTS